tara:strand:+ start:174 stop:338 length:165 start_codon:yes stop_codon:yes gene_type:complete
MGCNCGGSKIHDQKAKLRAERSGPYNRAKQVVRRMWEKTEQEVKPVNVTKINKK